MDADALKDSFCEACSTKKKYRRTNEECRGYVDSYGNGCFKMRIINNAPTLDLEPVPKWIPVEERLPEDEQGRVLVKLETIGHMEIDTDRRIDGRWVRWQGTVTHWMPLPEPPKGVE